jgi:hypothetical protein
MEDVLAVYTRPRDPDRPLVCLDETSKQLLAETRMPIPMKAGRPARFDYEYERNGTANLFMMFAPLEGWRHVKVTDRHTAVDYAHVLKDLADVHFASAKTVVLVQDNLNIHSKASLYEAFPAAEARRLVERFEWRYTPKHGSWLDLAECELAVLSSQRLDRRIPDKQPSSRKSPPRELPVRVHVRRCGAFEKLVANEDIDNQTVSSLAASLPNAQGGMSDNPGNSPTISIFVRPLTTSR